MANSLPDQSEKAMLRSEKEDADQAKILVVDDRPENLLVSRTMLDELGHQVITARSGDEALKYLLENDVAVILLDVNMPGMDGLETATYIRMRHKTAHTPIIFLTAYVEEMHTAKGYSLGAVDYILTPVMPDVLRTKVKVFVQLHLMTRQAERQAEQRIALAHEQAARAAAEEAKRRSTFLADASDVLSSSLDVTDTVRTLAQFVVPVLGDLCVIMLAGEPGEPGRTVVVWQSSDTAAGRHTELVAALDCSEINAAMQSAMESGRLVVATDAAPGPAGLAVTYLGVTEPKNLELGFKLGSIAALPLIARGRKLGALMLGTGAGDRRAGAGTLALAVDLATRAAVSLDNCLLYAKIQEGDQRKNEFLAMLAHELRNPLAPIRNAVQLLRMPDRGQSKLDWALSVLDRQTQQLTRLVDDLLDVARITQGRILLKLEPVDVAKVVGVAVEMSRPLINARGHDLTIAVPPAPLTVQGDYSRVAQILANLLNNAAKYTDPKGRISLRVEEDGAEVVFRVRDSGIGIPGSMLGSIFELFTQADRSLDRTQGGLGIGLTIVRRLVSMQGGSVRVYSDGAKQGSEFVVRLPRAAAGSAEPAQPAAPRRNGTGQRVLIVDDYADAADSMAAILRVDGQDVQIAHDGPTALEVVRNFKPSVVFLDIGLPGMNGFEVARALRAAPETKDSLLIAVSGYGQAEDQRQSKEAGFDRHLVKPVDLSVLQEILGATNASSTQASGRRGKIAS
jgi:signal transduction histidine kinase/DNA-binding response OmpR family regulator